MRAHFREYIHQRFRLLRKSLGTRVEREASDREREAKESEMLGRKRTKNECIISLPQSVTVDASLLLKD